MPRIARQADCQTCCLCEAYCPVDALFVAAGTTPGGRPAEADLVADGLLGGYRAALGWGRGALEFATDLRRRLVRAGRLEDDLRIFPATRIILGDSEGEARDKARWFRDKTWSDRRVRSVVEAIWGHDLSDHPVDEPLPAHDPVVATQTITHGVVNTSDRPLRTAAAWRELAAQRGFTMRELVLHLNDTVEFVGTPSAVADELARYVRAGAIDGLNLQANSVPGGFDEVVDRLVPALQDRGVYRTEYEGTTLRENLGLRPAVARRHRAVPA
ncbi:hypothetical protein [Pseudonocardia sp. NPDC049154]|uniref:hypothetical protein n=1 Tax=Pseudonocardia sp. NPDC049154 TaxID=3155501 RepID=UPI0033C4BC31